MLDFPPRNANVSEMNETLKSFRNFLGKPGELSFDRAIFVKFLNHLVDNELSMGLIGQVWHYTLRDENVRRKCKFTDHTREHLRKVAQRCLRKRDKNSKKMLFMLKEKTSCEAFGKEFMVINVKAYIREANAKENMEELCEYVKDLKTAVYVETLEQFIDSPATHLFLQSARTPKLETLLEKFEKISLDFLDSDKNVFLAIAHLVAKELSIGEKKKSAFELVQKYFIATDRKSTLYLLTLALRIALNENSIVKLLLSANKVVSSDTRKAIMAPFCIVLENVLSKEALEFIIEKAEGRFWRKHFKSSDNSDFQGFISMASSLTVSEELKFSGDSDVLLKNIKRYSNMHIWHRVFLMTVAKLDVEIASPIRRVEDTERFLRDAQREWTLPILPSSTQTLHSQPLPTTSSNLKKLTDRQPSPALPPCHLSRPFRQAMCQIEGYLRNTAHKENKEDMLRKLKELIAKFEE